MSWFHPNCKLAARLWLWLCFVWIPNLALNTDANAVTRLKAEQGEIDLSQWDDQETYSLYGDWYFVGKELLTPKSFLRFQQEGREFPTTTIGLSLQQSAPDKIRKPTGYGTYILRLKNLPPQSMLAMADIAAYVSARIYFFDAKGRGGEKPLMNLGYVTSNPRRAKSEISNNRIIPVQTREAGDYYVLIQVANHHHSWGGLWTPPVIGMVQPIQAGVVDDQKANFFIFGVMVFIAFYNFMLFLYRREDRGSLYLAAICVTLLTRTWLFNNYGRDFFGDGYWGVQISLKVIYISIFILPWSAYRSAQNFFPKQSPAWMDKVIPAVCLVSVIFIILTPSPIFGMIGNILFLLGVLQGAASAYIAFQAMRAREPGSRIVVFGVFSILIAAVIELLNAMNYIQFGQNTMTFGMTIYAACLSQIISTRFARAFRQAEHLSQELHSEVLRQTRDIRSLLDNLKQGIFTVVAGTQRVGSQFSASLRQIIGRDRIEGLTLRDLLLNHSDLNADRKDRIDATVQSSLGEDLMNFEVNAGMLIHDLTYTHPETQKKQYLELDWSPIFDQNETVEKLLISVRDVTEIRQLREQARLREEDFEILKELIDLAEDRFMRFLHQARDFLHSNKQIIATTQAKDSVQRLFINMHSLKGIARSYNLTLLADAVHHAEDTLSTLRAGKLAWDAERLETERRKVEDVCTHYERIALDKLGWAAAGSTIRVQKPVFKDLLNRIQYAARGQLSAESREHLAAVEMQLLELCFRPLSQVVDEATRGLDSLARSMDKLPPTLTVSVDHIILHENTAAALHGIFTHILRNSLDHGLEPMEDRQLAGKPEQGRIAIKAWQEGDRLLIAYADDGRGLDLDRLQQRAVENGIWLDGQRRSDQEVAELVFVSGLSTKNMVTDISGRGVGMDAVRTVLRELGGDISLELATSGPRDRRAFHLVLILPSRAFIQSVVTAGQAIPLGNTPGF